VVEQYSNKIVLPGVSGTKYDDIKALFPVQLIVNFHIAQASLGSTVISF